MKKILVSLFAVLMLATPALGARLSGSVSVPDGTWSGMVTATVSVPELPKNSTPAYVFGQCYVGDEYVWAKYHDVVGNSSEVGPLDSRLWPNGDAECVATLGYFTRNGFGKWVPLATDTFHVEAL